MIAASIMMWIWMISGWDDTTGSQMIQSIHEASEGVERVKGSQPLLLTTSPSRCAWGNSSHLFTGHLKLSLQLGTKGWNTLAKQGH